MPKRSKSSNHWVHRQSRDEYVKQARQQGWRSRAAIKLLQLDRQNNLLRSGMQVLDLGAAPGGWSQYAVSRVGGRGKIVAVDTAEINAIAGVNFIRGDIFSAATMNEINMLFANQKIDLVISDMAPNMTGISVIDMSRVLALAEAALDIAGNILHQEGAFLVKVFQGAGIDEYRLALKKCFLSVAVRKPPASRAESGEIYLLARQLKTASV